MLCEPNISREREKLRKTARDAHPGRKVKNPAALLPLHSPVNALHSIENQALTILFFLLT